jgi:hypothetical protein
MNRSLLDDGYLSERGFHWYAYDPAKNTFSDLSASEPGGTAADHGNVVTLASDPGRNAIYAADVPTGEIFRYDVSVGQTLGQARRIRSAIRPRRRKARSYIRIVRLSSWLVGAQHCLCFCLVVDF